MGVSKCRFYYFLMYLETRVKIEIGDRNIYLTPKLGENLDPQVPQKHQKNSK